MTSVFDSAENAALRARIQRLAPDTRPRWGKMNSAQMLAHCRRPIAVALGHLHLRRGLVGLLFGGFFKRRLIHGSMPFRPNLPTDPAFLVVDEPDFATERNALLAEIHQLADEQTLTRATHPFFGRLEADEWDRLTWKHLDHHLRQFSV